MFCPRCGKETKTLGPCIDCFIETHPQKIKKFPIILCRCGKILHKHQWKPHPEETLKEIVKENMTTYPEIKIEEINVTPMFKEKQAKIHVKIFGKYRNQQFNSDLNEEIKIDRKTCPICSKINSSYYEAVIQFRIPADIRKILEPSKVTWTEKVSGGVDAYITSASYARKIGKQYAQKGYITNRTAKIVGKKDGKDIYREYISIKTPDFNIGDFIEYRKKNLMILNYGKNLQVKDIETGKTFKIPLTRLQNIKTVACKEDVRSAIVSAITPHKIQLTDLENLNQIEIKNINKKLVKGDEVRYIKIRETIYLLQ